MPRLVHLLRICTALRTRCIMAFVYEDLSVLLDSVSIRCAAA
jgi:hypothetical protein